MFSSPFPKEKDDLLRQGEPAAERRLCLSFYSVWRSEKRKRLRMLRSKDAIAFSDFIIRLPGKKSIPFSEIVKSLTKIHKISDAGR
jgi:hypothetical protein